MESGPKPRRGTLVIEVPCGDLRGDLDGGTHPVAINADWSVDVGHDLELERMAAGLGASPSCLHLLDTVVPAFRTWLQLKTRRALPAMRRWPDRVSWTVRHCECEYLGGTGAPSLDLADTVEHARSEIHFTLANSCDDRLMRPLTLAAADAFGNWGGPRLGPADHLVSEPDGVQQLWDLGLHPGWVIAGHQRFAPSAAPLPAMFYVALAYLRPDQRYLEAVLEACRDGDFATWALWSHDWFDARYPDARAALLRAGVAPADLRDAMDRGYATGEIRALSCRSDRRLAQSAASLAAWARIGCKPHVDDLSWGIGRVLTDDRLIPSAASLDALVALLPPNCDISRTEAGQVLAVAGSVQRARLLLANGVRTPTAAYEYLDDHGFLDRTPAGKSPRSGNGVA